MADGLQNYYPLEQCQSYRDLKRLWFNLKRQGKYFEADQVKGRMRKIKKNK